MNNSIFLILVVCFILANLPWLSEKFFIIFPSPYGGQKRIWMRFLEWGVFGCLAMFFTWGLEQKITGSTHSQEWEFYAIFVSLFFVFAFPSFIYRHLIVPLSTRNSL